MSGRMDTDKPIAGAIAGPTEVAMKRATERAMAEVMVEAEVMDISSAMRPVNDVFD